MVVLGDEVTKILHVCLFSFCFTRLALQTVNIIKKITQLKWWKNKNEVTKYVMSRAKVSNFDGGGICYRYYVQTMNNFKHFFPLLVSRILQRQWQKRIGLLTLVTTCRTYLPWGIKKVPSPLTILSSLDDIITRLQAHCSFSHHTKSFQIELCHIIL